MSKVEKICDNCKHGNCLRLNHRSLCRDWEQKETEVVLSAEWLVTEIADIIYNQGKAKMFNVMESQLDPGPKLDAVKQITQNIISEIAKNVSNVLKDALIAQEGDIHGY